MKPLPCVETSERTTSDEKSHPRRTKIGLFEFPMFFLLPHKVIVINVIHINFVYGYLRIKLYAD
jgi:hypothetical protein